MNTKGNHWDLRILIGWLIIIVVACVVYTTGLTHESIWYDEAYSASISAHTPIETLLLTPYDNHPPLYYFLLSMVQMVLGNSVWALRSLSVLGAVALVSLGAGPVRRIFGNRTAFIYAAVIIFTPTILIYAHEARMYTLAIFAVTAGALFGYLAVQANRTRDWICFGLATLAGAYLHYYGLVAGFFMHAAVLIWLLVRKRAQIKAGLITGALVFVGYLPWLIVFINQTISVRKGFWLGPPNLISIGLAFLQPFAYKELYPTILPTTYLALLVSVGLVIWGLVIARRKQAQPASSLGLFVLFVYLGTLITTILVSLFFMPIFYSRYLLVCVGLFLLLTTLGISLLPGKYLPWVAVGVLAFLNVFTLKDIYTQKFNHPMNLLAQKLGNAIQPGDLIITSESYSMGPATYYFPQAEHYYSNNSIEAQWGTVLKAMTPPLHYEEGLKELLSTRKTFWYITCNTGIAKNIAEILKDEPGWEKSESPITVSEPYVYVQFTAQKYEYTGRVNTQGRGALTVHMTGLKPGGDLILFLLDSRPPFGLDKADRVGALPVMGPEASYTFYDLAYGDYALAAYHDANKNNAPDFDPVTQMPTEGWTGMNIEKADFSQGFSKALALITFDSVKFSFQEPEKSIEIKMYYPPFTELGNK